MLRLPSIAIATAFYFAAAMTLTVAATSKKITYEQAWAKCKKELDKTVPWDQHAAKASAGTACMQRYGYRI